MNIFNWLAASGLVMVGQFAQCDNTPPAQLSAGAQSSITHLVVVVQENHSFDSYFGRYCQAAVGSNPTCELGRNCCEAGPERDARSGATPLVLDDRQNLAFDPIHAQSCELAEMHGGKMDRYVQGAPCSASGTFAYASETSAASYWRYADRYALADRYFQSVAGASSSNDMYLARAQYVFTDNFVKTKSIGSQCRTTKGYTLKSYSDPTIGDLLTNAGVAWAYYSEGYRDMLTAQAHGGCPRYDKACAAKYGAWACFYDATDNPFQYYKSTMDNLEVMKDHGDFFRALAEQKLPAVSFLKPLSANSEHPREGSITDGMKFVDAIVNAVQGSGYVDSTLILLTQDESGGYFDHVPPPAVSGVDKQPYGPRIPLLAVGHFARKGMVSHVEMEHSSIVKFIEWNWLGSTGQLSGRDTVVHNIGSLLDNSLTRVAVPAD